MYRLTICIVREEDAKGTRWRLFRGTYHLQLQNIFFRKLRGFFRQSRMVCFSRILDEFNVLHVVFVQAETVLLKRRSCRQQNRADFADPVIFLNVSFLFIIIFFYPDFSRLGHFRKKKKRKTRIGIKRRWFGEKLTPTCFGLPSVKSVPVWRKVNWVL